MKEKYRVISHTFLGEKKDSEGKVYGYKYEITFNKSLIHTGKHDGIEEGLNRYTRQEKRFNKLMYWVEKIISIFIKKR